MHKFLGNRIVTIIALASLSLSLIGCGKKEPVNIKTAYAQSVAVEAEQPKGEMYTDSFSDYDRRDANPITSDMLKSMNEFTNQSASQILKGAKENISYSPISLYMALSVLAEGSEETTAEELFQALGMSDVDYDVLSTNIDTFYKNLYRMTDVSRLKIANAVWMDEKMPFKKDYCDTVAGKYHTSLFNVDFSDPSTSKVMEEWIAKELNNYMKPKVEIDSQQVMTIMNTIYYTNQWSERFNKERTKEDTFYLANNDKVRCDFLNKTISLGQYVDGDGYKTFRLYLENGDAMIFCLPDEDVAIDDLVSDKNSMEKLFKLDKEKDAEITLSLPKFDYGCKFDLLEMMEKMGIHQAMDMDHAQFKKMSDKNLFLSKATQQVRIAIDEVGVTAAAYTELGLKCGCAMAEDLEKVELNFNRPFLYSVQSCDGVTLFTGIVQDPTQK